LDAALWLPSNQGQPSLQVSKIAGGMGATRTDQTYLFGLPVAKIVMSGNKVPNIRLFHWSDEHKSGDPTFEQRSTQLGTILPLNGDLGAVVLESASVDTLQIG